LYRVFFLLRAPLKLLKSEKTPLNKEDEYSIHRMTMVIYYPVNPVHPV
jgi:hypothetical protein